MLRIKKTINKIKRAKKIFNRLEYGAGAWWLMGADGWQKAILYDKELKLINAGNVRLFLEKIRVSWMLASWFLLNNDGLYIILEESIDGYRLYKENIGWQ
jgi:hypothetical protein